MFDNIYVWNDEMYANSPLNKVLVFYVDKSKMSAGLLCLGTGHMPAWRSGQLRTE